MKKLNVAIIGQGRSGRDIHGHYFKSEANTKYVVKYVVEKDPARRARAEEEYEGCKAFATYQELFGIKDIDLVVNASFSEMHYPITKDLLEHGFNVLVEKPFARNRFEANDLIRTAKENNVQLAVFQQTFLAPYYLKVKEIVDSGVLGRIKQISVMFNGFARRYDWQTLQKKMAGNAYNTGPHPIGIAYGLIDFDPTAKLVYTNADHMVSSGDADDYVKMIIETADKKVLDIEINSIDKFSTFNIKVQAELGCLIATPKKLSLKLVDQEQSTQHPVEEESLQNEEGLPMYCKSTVVFKEEEIEFGGTAFDVGTANLYESVYETITTGKELRVKNEDLVWIYGALEQLHAENPLPRKF